MPALNRAPRRSDRDRYVLAFGAILVLALYRLWVIEFSALELDIEEAYYLHWSTEPAFGYFSKPPMIAWLLAAATELFGRSELAVKSVSLSLHTATAFLVYSIGKRLYGPPIGLAAGVVFTTLPVVGALSLYSTTDAPLHFFWALTLRLFLKARDSGRLVWWLAAGVAGGLGLLSKYTMGLLAVGLALGLAFSRTDRRWLGSPQLWAGVAAAAVVWTPNLWWNANNDFISFRHTAHISQLHRDLLHPDHLAEFLVAQLVVFGPVLFLVLLLAVVRRSVWSDARHRLLLLASLPILGLISLQALLAEANMNWASPAYVGLSVFVTAWLWEQSRYWLYLGIALNLLLLSVAYHYHDLADAFDVEMSANRTPYKHRVGWRALGSEVREWTRSYPDAWLVGESRKLLAYMSYYGVDTPRSLLSWNPDGTVKSQFDLEGDVSDHPQEQFLFLSPDSLRGEILDRFEGVLQLGEKRIEVFPDLSRSVHGYLLSGFRGY